jgi:hypothetical protein
MKRVKLFEQFVLEAKKVVNHDIFFKNAEWDWTVYEEPVFMDFTEGTVSATRVKGQLFAGGISPENMKKFIEYVKAGVFDTQYKTGSFLIRKTSDWDDQIEVTTKEIKDGWSPFNDKEDVAATSADLKAKDGDTSKVKEVTQAIQAKMAKKYETWERGVIRAWGNIFYLDYHSMPKSGKTQSLAQLKKDFTVLQNTDMDSYEYEELQDWLQEYGRRGGVPLFNKKVMDGIFASIAKKTPAPFDFIIYRTSKKEQDGVNSYTTEKGAYLDWAQGTERAYLIPKGTPVIFADADADDNEIIWMPTKSDLTKYKIS